MFNCKICENEYPMLLSLSKHLTNKHKYNGGLIQYYIDYENLSIPKCFYCDKQSKYDRGLKFRKTCNSKDCLEKEFRNRKHTEITKIKISEKLKDAYERNGENMGWSFINKDVNKRSYPEKWFIKNVLEKYELYSKYSIKEKLSFGKYFLDFAILDMKIDIEIDGSQHFTEESIQHDKERDSFLLNSDWKVYRIAWLELLNKPDITIYNFLKWLNENEKYRKYNVSDILIFLKKKELIYGSTQKYYEKRNEMLFEKNKLKIETIKNSNIDFTKYGWVKKVSILINLHHQKVNSWMKKYMKEFYELYCYKRN